MERFYYFYFLNSETGYLKAKLILVNSNRSGEVDTQRLDMFANNFFQ